MANVFNCFKQEKLTFTFIRRPTIWHYSFSKTTDEANLNKASAACAICIVDTIEPTCGF